MWYIWDYGDLVGLYKDKEVADQDCKWLVDDYYFMSQKRIPKMVIRQNIKVVEARAHTVPAFAGKEHINYGV